MDGTSIITIMNDNSAPYISVLVLAYDRKDYIMRAVKSVLEQELGTISIEILVVKNFIDEKLDSALESLGCKIINSTIRELGGKIIEGISHSNGQIVSLLEDDDFFYPGKLKKIEKEFKENPELVFYQHPTDVWDMEATRLIKAGSRKDGIICRAPVSTRDFKKYFAPHSKSGIYNNSSYSLRRNSFLIDLGPFKEMIRGCDDYLFLCSLSLTGYIKLGNQSLGARTLNLTDTYEDSEVKKFLDNSAIGEESNLKTYEVYLEHFKNDPQRRMSHYLRLRSLLRYAIFKPYALKFKDLFTTIKISFYCKEPYLFTLLFWVILSKINKRKVQIRFYNKESIRKRTYN